MQIPVIPSFTAGETNVTHLQQLSTAVSFLSVVSNTPWFRFTKSSTFALSGGSWQTINFNTVELDTDSVHNATTGGVQINTRGYYRMEAALPFQGPASADSISAAFLLTVGPNNPNFTNGTTLRFGGKSATFPSTTGIDWAYCIGDIVPYVLYPNDTIVVQVYPLGTTATNVLTNTGSASGWFSPQFSGHWIRTGT